MKGVRIVELMSSLPLEGDFIKFAANLPSLASVAGPSAGSICTLTSYFDVPQNGHSCILVNSFTATGPDLGPIFERHVGLIIF